MTEYIDGCKKVVGRGVLEFNNGTGWVDAITPAQPDYASGQNVVEIISIDIDPAGEPPDYSNFWGMACTFKTTADEIRSTGFYYVQFKDQFDKWRYRINPRTDEGSYCIEPPEHINGCYKLKDSLTGPIVRSPCTFEPGDNGYVDYCSVPGSVPNRANEIISVERTLYDDNPDLAWFVLTWLDGSGVERSNASSPMGTDKDTTFSIYTSDVNCEKDISDPTPEPTPEPGCTLFDTTQYQYVRFVGKGTATGLRAPWDLTDKSEIFYGYYIDDEGNIETPWTVLDEGGERSVGGLWNYQLMTGGGSPRLYDATTNTTNGYHEFEFGGLRKTSWTPAVNFYDHVDQDIPGGPQIGTGNGVPWRAYSTVTTNGGLQGGYGSKTVAIGDLSVNNNLANPLQTFTSQPAFAVRALASLHNTGTESGLYPEEDDVITLTIRGHWEFSNDQVTVEATWSGTNDLGQDIDYLKCTGYDPTVCPNLLYNPVWLSNPCPRLEPPIGPELTCPELPGPPEDLDPPIDIPEPVPTDECTEIVNGYGNPYRKLPGEDWVRTSANYDPTFWKLEVHPDDEVNIFFNTSQYTRKMLGWTYSSDTGYAQEPGIYNVYTGVPRAGTMEEARQAIFKLVPIEGTCKT